MFFAMQLFPHALPFVQTLQQACAGGLVGSTTTGGTVGESVGGRNIVGMFVGVSVLVGFGVRVGPMVLVGASVKNRVAVGFFVAVAVLGAVAVTLSVEVGSITDVILRRATN